MVRVRGSRGGGRYMAGTRCFAYGSLMCETIMAAVVGTAVRGEPARLVGYSRYALRGEGYPGAVAEAAGAIDGVLYRDLRRAALVRLDAFEGSLYERRQVRVNPVGGGRVVAWCYIFRGCFRHRLLPRIWRIADFTSQRRARFIARYLRRGSRMRT